jgi:high-affinity nickel-transport protein
VTAILLGLVLGMRHALDADHVVAVTAIVTRERSIARAARVGLWWGIGHTTTIVLVGGSIILFRLVVPPRVGLAFEFLVALMLIALGALNLWRARDDTTTTPTLPPLVVGLVHGLAGSAALALLVLAAIRAPSEGVLYLAVFGAGTICGMMAVTAAIAAPTLVATRRVTAMRRYVRAGAGVLSLAFGLLLAHDVGVRHQLFGAAPSWIPE